MAATTHSALVKIDGVGGMMVVAVLAVAVG